MNNEPILQTVEFSFLWYFAGVNLVYTFFLLLASFKTISRIKEIREEDTGSVLGSNSLPTILFVVPMYNESKTAVRSLSNLILLSYRYKQIIAVNDGSDDDTLEQLKTYFDLIEIPKFYTDVIETKSVRKVYQSKKHPEITVIDKERGRKFDAINAAINAVPTPFFVVLDADTFIDSKGFESLVRPILTSPQTIAVGASVRLMNGCDIDFNRVSTARFPDEFLPAVQSLEYLRAFLLRNGLDVVNGNFIVAGAFSIFPRELIVEIGGFAPSVGEDVEIIVRLHRVMHKSKHRYHIQYLPDPVAWTLAPDTFSDLGRQRSRWHQGLLESIWYHKAVFFNPTYRYFGVLGFPFWFLGELLEPIVETCAWIYVIVAYFTGFLNLPFFLLLLGVSYGYTAIYTIYCLFVEELSFRKYPSLRSLLMLLTANLLENFGYRQCTVYWRLRGFVWFFKNFKRVRVSSRQINDWVKKASLKLKQK